MAGSAAHLESFRHLSADTVCRSCRIADVLEPSHGAWSCAHQESQGVRKALLGGGVGQPDSEELAPANARPRPETEDAGLAKRIDGRSHGA